MTEVDISNDIDTDIATSDSAVIVILDNETEIIQTMEQGPPGPPGAPGESIVGPQGTPGEQGPQGPFRALPVQSAAWLSRQIRRQLALPTILFGTRATQGFCIFSFGMRTVRSG